MLKVNHRDTTTTFPFHVGVFFVNFEHISYFGLLSLLLTLNMYFFDGYTLRNMFLTVIHISQEKREQVSLSRNTRKSTADFEHVFF